MDEDLPSDLQQDIDLVGPPTGSDIYICTRELDELPAPLHREIERMCEEGDAFMDRGEHLPALRRYRVALERLPQPRCSWIASVRLLCGMGDALWFLRQHAVALPLWNAALLGGSLGNAFAHLRRGQTLYELGRYKLAQNELLRALLLGGNDIFANEPAKYWEFITSQTRLPAGRSTWEGWTGVDEDGELYAWLLDLANYEMRWESRE
jgi:tetratricopeptide (TPR) repeat protein